MEKVVQALKDSREAHLIVVVDFDGDRFGFSVSPVQIPGAGFPIWPDLLTEPQFSTSLSLSALRFSEFVSSFTISNERRFQDIEATRRAESGRAYLYLWAPGLSWGDIAARPIAKGRFERVGYSKTTYSFSVSDLASMSAETVSSLSISATTPGSVIHQLLSFYCALDPDDIDRRSIGAMDAITGGETVSPVIDTAADVLDIVDRVCYEFNFGRVSTGGKVAVVPLYIDREPIAYIRESEMLGFPEIETTGRDLIVNKLTVEYDYVVGSGYTGSFTLDRTNNAVCLNSFEKYGIERSQSISYPDLGEKQAAASAARLLTLLSTRRDTVKINVPHYVGAYMREGTIAEIDLDFGADPSGRGWIWKRGMLLDKTIGMNTVAQRWLIMNQRGDK